MDLVGWYVPIELRRTNIQVIFLKDVLLGHLQLKLQKNSSIVKNASLIVTVHANNGFHILKISNWKFASLISANEWTTRNTVNKIYK